MPPNTQTSNARCPSRSRTRAVATAAANGLSHKTQGHGTDRDTLHNSCVGVPTWRWRLTRATPRRDPLS